MFNFHARKPLLVKLKLMTRELNFEIDTGSGISIKSETTYRNYFSDMKLLKTKVKLRTYSEEPLIVLGKFTTVVEYEGKQYNGLNLYVVKGDGVNLMGRNWLTNIRLNWNKVVDHYSDDEQHTFHINNNGMPTPNKLSKILNEYSELFTEELGNIKDVKAKISIKPDAQPKFGKREQFPSH